MVLAHFGYLFPPSEPMRDYAADLYQRIGEGVVVPRVVLKMEGWDPDPNRCHDNAMSIAEKSSGYRVVTGWLFFDFGYALPFVRFTAHSVVENRAGELFDVTPLPLERPYAALYPFIRSALSHDDFHSVVYYLTEAHGTAHLDHALT